jgi:hypothetical protein
MVKLDVAGSRRQVENQEIQIPPGDLTKKLLRVAGHHGPAQDRWRSVIKQKPHRHQGNAVTLDGDDAVFIISRGPFVGSAEHESDARTVDVAIAEPGLCARVRQGEGEICSDGGFADTAFSAGHGNHMLHAFDLGGSDGPSGGRRRLDIDFHRNSASA